MRRTALVAMSGGVIFGCAQIAGLDDERSSSSGASGTPGANEAGGKTGDYELVPASLDFGPSDCAKERVEKVTLYNHTKNEAEYSVTSPDRIFVIKKNGRGTIPKGGSAELEIAVLPTDAKTVDTGLKVVFNGEEKPYPVKATGRGATFEPSQTNVDFGDVRKEIGGETKITIKNSGSAPLSSPLEAVTPVAAFEVIPSTVNVPAQGSADVVVKLKSSTTSDPAPVVAQFKPKVEGVCGTAPPLDVRGKRITTDVTIDTVDWGDVLCKSTPTDRQARIRNYGPSQINFTSAITGTLFGIRSGGTGMIPGGSEGAPTTQMITLSATPGTVPGQKDETLTITYGAGQTSTGKVREYVAGLVLNITPATSNFTSDGGTEQLRKFDITNNAGKFGGYFNLNAGYQTTGAGFRAQNGTGSYQPAVLIFPPTTGSVEVVYKATVSGPVTGNLNVTGPVCSQTTVTLNGTSP